MDLLVWFDEKGIARFQLGYDKDGADHGQRIFSWRSGVGYDHLVVGRTEEGKPFKPMPLPADVAFDGSRVAGLFIRQSMDLPHEVVDFVLEKIAVYHSGDPKDDLNGGTRRKMRYW